MDLKNRTAIITGAGKGIGKAIAMSLASEGVDTFLCARNEKELMQACEECKALGARSTYLALDLAQPEATDTLFNSALQTYGRVDILINNAGVLIPDGIFNVTHDDWDRTMDVNVRAAFFLGQAAMQDMATRNEGYIINICSTVALGAKPEVTTYSVSKYALMGISEALYQEGKKHSVRVSTIYPGVTDTPMLRSQDMPCTPDTWMIPEDIAYCVLFLLKSSERMVVKDVVPWATKYDKI